MPMTDDNEDTLEPITGNADKQGDLDPNNKSAEDRYNDELAEEIAKIQAYRASIEAEFKNADADDPEFHKKARNKLIELVPDAGETIAFLLKYSTSDAVRGNLAKFVFAEAMRAADKGKEGDVLADLVTQLQGNDD